MPYIKPDKRAVLDSAINAVVDGLRQLESDDETNNFEGNVNYIFSTIIAKCYDVSYRSINDVVGVLTCVKDEYYARVAIPYEKQKAFENGDVYEERSPQSVLRRKVKARKKQLRKVKK